MKSFEVDSSHMPLSSQVECDQVDGGRLGGRFQPQVGSCFCTAATRTSTSTPVYYKKMYGPGDRHVTRPGMPDSCRFYKSSELTFSACAHVRYVLSYCSSRRSECLNSSTMFMFTLYDISRSIKFYFMHFQPVIITMTTNHDWWSTL